MRISINLVIHVAQSELILKYKEKINLQAIISRQLEGMIFKSILKIFTLILYKLKKKFLNFLKTYSI